MYEHRGFSEKYSRKKWTQACIRLPILPASTLLALDDTIKNDSRICRDCEEKSYACHNVKIETRPFHRKQTNTYSTSLTTSIRLRRTCMPATMRHRPELH